MTPHDHHHETEQAHDHETGLADLLDLDAEVLGSYLDEVTEWAEQHAPEVARTVVDVGAGTGTGSLALARRFGAAEVVAIDRSAAMLERLLAAAREQGLADRLRIVHADLDVAWPPVAAVDVAWAASSLHEALARANWNTHPDWRPHLERAGFEFAAQRGFTVEASPGPSTGRYADAYLRRIRSALDDRLDADDLHTLDRLLADDSPDAVLRRRDLTVRGSRTAWAARRL